MAPPPPTPPPPPPLGFHPDDPHNNDHSDSHHSDVCPMEETPLIGSRTKKQPILHPVVYSSIPEVTLTNSQDEDDEDDLDDDQSVNTTSTATSVSSFSTVSSLAENFKESLLLPFTDEDGTNVGQGLAALAVIGTTLGTLVYLVQGDTGWKRYASSICGYNYLILWSVCFYPQAVQNYKRQSTHGVSPDFALLNLMGWTYYSTYMASLFFQARIRQLYEERFHEKSTVAFNDVLFSVHAMLLSLLYVLQILYYSHKKKRQRSAKHHATSTGDCFGCPTLKLKPTTWVLVLGMGLPTLIMPILVVSDLASNWLDYLYMLSFFKIFCTLTKYSKQTYFNYKRQSTRGWNIWYNFLEASGGTLSMVQLVLDAKDISGITGNLAKFLLGFATLAFDCIFFLQHYVWYAPPKEQVEEEDGYEQPLDGTSAKRIPKHLRASSRFEIVIPPTDDMALDIAEMQAEGLLANPLHQGGNNPKHLNRGTSDVSLDDDSISRNSSIQGIGRL